MAINLSLVLRHSRLQSQMKAGKLKLNLRRQPRPLNYATHTNTRLSASVQSAGVCVWEGMLVFALLLNISFPLAQVGPGCLVCKTRRCQCQDFSSCVRNTCRSNCTAAAGAAAGRSSSYPYYEQVSGHKLFLFSSCFWFWFLFPGTHTCQSRKFNFLFFVFVCEQTYSSRPPFPGSTVGQKMPQNRLYNEITIVKDMRIIPKIQRLSMA